MKYSNEILEEAKKLEQQLKALDESLMFIKGERKPKLKMPASSDRSSKSYVVQWKKGTASAPDLGSNEEYYFRSLDRYFKSEGGRARLKTMWIDREKTNLFDFDEAFLEKLFPIFVTMYEMKASKPIAVKDSISVNDEQEAKIAMKDLVKKRSGSEMITVEDSKGSLLGAPSNGDSHEAPAGETPVKESEEEDRSEFQDPHGRSALRRSSRYNPRILPCPTCKEPNKLTPKDKKLGYQCDDCADRDEGAFPGGYY